MSNPVTVYIGTYENLAAAETDLDVVRDLYRGDATRTYDAAVITKDADGRVRVRQDDERSRHAIWEGAAVGALVGILFPPSVIASTIVGAAAGLLAGHLWRGMSRGDLKDLGEALDAGEASLVVISTSPLDTRMVASLKAKAHQIKELTEADAKALERDLKDLVA
jgi:uncharacterized membrane protein